MGLFTFELKINDSGVPDTVPVVKEESSPKSTFYKDIAGFSLGIAASLLIAIGTGCIQVRQNGAWGERGDNKGNCNCLHA